MSNMNTVRKSVLISFVMAFITASVSLPAMADMIDNTQLSDQTQIEMQRDGLRTMLARDDVRTAMQSHGISNADIDQRIANMTPNELNQIHGRLETLPAGGAAGTVLTVLLILLLLEVLGVTDIFSGV